VYSIISIGQQVVSDPGYRWEGMKRPGGGLILQYTLHGEGVLEMGSEVAAVGAHHAFLVRIPGAHAYYWAPDSDRPWEFVWIRIEHPGINGFYARISKALGHVFPLDPEGAVITGLIRLLQDVRDDRIPDEYELSARIFHWLTDLLRYADRKGSTQAGLPPRYRELLLYLDDRLHLPLTLADLAAAVGVSRCHFCKNFAQFMGITPMDYVRRRRIDRAQELLLSTELPIAVIAEQTGFASASYFGKVFRAETGLSPTDYRARFMEVTEWKEFR